MTHFARHIVLTLTLLTALQTLIASAALGAAAPTVDILSRKWSDVSSPLRLAGDSGNLFVSDPREGGVLKFDASGRLLRKLPVASPGGIAVTPQGDLVVSQGRFVSVLDPNGVERFKLGKGVGQFKLAKGVAVDSEGFIYVVDSLDFCIQVFNASGAPVSIGTAAAGKPTNSFGSLGMLPNQFYRPTGITYEKASRQLAVVDSLNGRVQFFSTNGEYQKTIGSHGTGPMKFTSPHAVAFEYTKNDVLSRMYVVDAFQSNVQAIDPTGNGTFLRFIGSYGAANGQLEVPTDAFFDAAAKRLVVVNSRGNLTMYGIDGGVTQGAGSGPTVTIDTIPTLTSPSAVLHGQMSAGAEVTVNGMPAEKLSETSWYYSISGLTQGEHLVTVKATDAVGSSIATTTIKVEIALPQLAVNRIIGVTNISSQEITGTMDEGVAISAVSNTAAIVGAISTTATTWRFTISGLVPGENKITISGSKNGGTATTEVTIRLDRALLQVSALSDGSVTTAQTQNLTGTVSTVIGQVSVNGKDAIITNGRFSMPLVLDFGPNEIVVVAKDRSGNSFTDRRTITLDTTKPTIEITYPADGALTRSSLITVTGTASLGSSVVVNGKPALMDGTSWKVNLDLIRGLNTIEATVTGTAPQVATNVKRIYTKDFNGLGSEVPSSSVKRTVSYDPIGVNLAVTSPLSDIITNNSSVVVSGYAHGATTLTMSAVLNGVTTPMGIDKDGNFTTQLELPAAGPYDLMIVAADTLGNASTMVRNIVYETKTPQFAVNVVPSTPNVVTGTIEPGATVSLTDKDGNDIGSIEITNGQWRATLPANYDPAEQFLTVVSAAGNSSRNGDTDGDGTVDIVDAVKVMRMALGLEKPTPTQMLRTDVGSARGAGKPDGKIDGKDILAVMHRVVGLSF